LFFATKVDIYIGFPTREIERLQAGNRQTTQGCWQEDKEDQETQTDGTLS